jgi:DNA-directed RNA polymerase alpha subunit
VTAAISLYAPVASLWPPGYRERGRLGTLALNTLRRSGARTVEDVTAMTAQDIAGMRNAGTGTLAEVRRVLAVHGLALTGETAEGLTRVSDAGRKNLEAP